MKNNDTHPLDESPVLTLSDDAKALIDTGRLKLVLADIRLYTHELRNMVQQCEKWAVKYLPPLSVKPSDLGDLVLDYTGDEYSPIPITSSTQVNDIWGFTAPPNRLQNSLPRYVGYIALPADMYDNATALIERTNKAKEDLIELTKDAMETLVEHDKSVKKFRRTDVLIALDVLTEKENYELVVRPINSTKDLHVKSILSHWVSKSSQSDRFRPINEISERLDPNNSDDALLLQAIQRFENEHPGSTYGLRYNTPPQPEIRFTHPAYDTPTSQRVITNQRYGNSSPLIVLKWDNKTKFGPVIERLNTELINGKISMIKSAAEKEKADRTAAKKGTTCVRLIDGFPWYGMTKKNSPNSEAS